LTSLYPTIWIILRPITGKFFDIKDKTSGTMECIWLSIGANAHRSAGCVGLAVQVEFDVGIVAEIEGTEWSLSWRIPSVVFINAAVAVLSTSGLDV
jgi:hypothetical protein